MNTEPFFIVGCGRSGTTLLRTLLNRHPQIAIPLESLFIVDYLKAAPRFEISKLRSLIVQEPEIEEWGITPSWEDLESCQTIAEVIVELHRIYTRIKGKRCWGQKTPRFVREAELILTYFPGALFIHVVRDPRAVVNSLIHSDVHRSNAYHASIRWRMDVQSGLELERLHPENVLRVHYEDMVRDPEKTLRSILSFLNLSYDPVVGESSEQSSAEYSRFYDNIHANIDRGTTDQYIEKWRKSLSGRDVEVVESLTGDFMQVLHYERTIESPIISPGYKAWMRFNRLFGLIRQTARYLRYRRKYLLFLIWRKWRLGLLVDFLWDVNY